MPNACAVVLCGRPLPHVLLDAASPRRRRRGLQQRRVRLRGRVRARRGRRVRRNVHARSARPRGRTSFARGPPQASCDERERQRHTQCHTLCAIDFGAAAPCRTHHLCTAGRARLRLRDCAALRRRRPLPRMPCAVLARRVRARVVGGAHALPPSRRACGGRSHSTRRTSPHGEPNPLVGCWLLSRTIGRLQNEWRAGVGSCRRVDAGAAHAAAAPPAAPKLLRERRARSAHDARAIRQACVGRERRVGRDWNERCGLSLLLCGQARVRVRVWRQTRRTTSM